MTLTTIPLNRITAPDAINARPRTDDELAALAAAIDAKGLIQPLAVRPADGSDRYEVIDGRRRLQALQLLVRQKRINKDAPIAAIVRNEDDTEALETSLMANTVRMPMHPVDQHEVMAKLSDSGLGTADIASRFGITERTVRQHLALGRLAPEVRKEWRKGRIDAEVARAFAACPDPVRQAEVLDTMVRHHTTSAWHVRRELTDDERVRVDQCDELALVGEAAYLAAGGTIEEDLFEDHRYVGDVPLVRRLARGQLVAARDKLRDAGWSWAGIEDDDGVWPHYQCKHVRGHDGDDEAAPESYSKAERSKSGCIVRIGYHDRVAYIEHLTGLVRPDPRQTGLDEDGDPGRLPPVSSLCKPEPEPDGPFDVSEALRITVHESLTKAAAQVLKQQPDLALQALVAQMMTSSSGGPVKVSDHGDAVVSDSSKRDYRMGWHHHFRALDGRSPDALRVMLAHRVAQALNLVPSAGYNASTEPAQVYALRDSLPGPDYLAAMRAAFLAEDYFSRTGKQTAIAALEEMHAGGARFGLGARDDLERKKKTELAAWAAEQAKTWGWLPPELRHPEYALLVPEAKEPRAASGKMAAAGDAEPARPAKKRRAA
jgi:ParB family chromosome partitioning protein